MKDEGRLQGKNLHPSPFNLQLKGLNHVQKQPQPRAEKDVTKRW